jgi:predicted nuclease of predicted toxin-antitoxin system
MRVLIDECAPRALQAYLTAHGHECVSVQDAGWSGKQNGELLNLVEGRFDVLVTLDTNLRYQQNLSARRVGIVVILAPSNRLVDLKPHFAACASAMGSIKPGQMVLVGQSG